VAHVLYGDLRGSLESKVWLEDGFSQDLLGRDGNRFKPSLPKSFLFPISDVLPSPELIDQFVVKRNTEVPVALPVDQKLAVAAARPEDRDSMRSGLETVNQIYEKRAHYDPETDRQVRPRKKKKKEQVVSQAKGEENSEEVEEAGDQGEEEGEGDGEGEVGIPHDTSEVKQHDFAIVEEKCVRKKAKRQLYLARVLDPTPPITLYLWIINESKKITPTFASEDGSGSIEKPRKNANPQRVSRRGILILANGIFSPPLSISLMR
jgi:hypothetical protein